MDKIVKSQSFVQLKNELLGKRARFKSTCEFFPKFDVIGKVVKIYLNNGETIFEVKCDNQKQIKIGSNMKNLSYQLLN